MTKKRKARFNCHPWIGKKEAKITIRHVRGNLANMLSSLSRGDTYES